MNELLSLVSCLLPLAFCLLPLTFYLLSLASCLLSLASYLLSLVSCMLEVSGVDWNLVSKDQFASSSWDGTVKLWRPGAPVSLRTFDEHGRRPVYGGCKSRVLLFFS